MELVFGQLSLLSLSEPLQTTFVLSLQIGQSRSQSSVQCYNATCCIATAKDSHIKEYSEPQSAVPLWYVGTALLKVSFKKPPLIY